MDFILANDTETVPCVQGGYWIPLEVLESCFEVLGVGKLKRLQQNSCAQAPTPVGLQDIELAELQVSGLNIN